ncbi:uncharacterized N-acetyltransferase p20-like [Macadamia integrifolia]|uniref:uncharacterized N-acetyltransferase p20-like n=1 Tax=Macadamia integrifolia TaxID=60698 RepID=UPI001C4FB221|nr:uncharacterized N-acetyltransferase p20-like [Macadamia integrifolia]
MDSSRVSLRTFKLSDVDDFLEWASDDQVTQFLLKWKVFTSRDEALNFIKDICIPHPCCRSICLDDRSIGFISITPSFGDDKCRADIGYAIATKYWGQGIAAIAVKMALASGFKDFHDVVRLQAKTDLENKASQRVLEKAGFFKEGMLRKYCFHRGQIRDLVIYSFLVTETVLN